MKRVYLPIALLLLVHSWTLVLPTKKTLNHLDPDTLAHIMSNLSIISQNEVRLLGSEYHKFVERKAQETQKILTCTDIQLSQILAFFYTTNKKGQALPLFERVRLLLFKAIKSKNLTIAKKLMNLFLTGGISFYTHKQKVSAFNKTKKPVLKRFAFFNKSNRVNTSTLYTRPLKQLLSSIKNQKNGDTILHACVRSGASKILDYFLTLLSKNNICTTSPKKLITYTEQNNSKKAHIFLTKTGLHPDGLVNKNNKTFITLAYELYGKKKKHPITSIIKRFFPKMQTVLQIATEAKSLETMRILIKHKASVTACDSHGKTALSRTTPKCYFIADNNDKKIVKLIESEALKAEFTQPCF